MSSSAARGRPGRTRLARRLSLKMPAGMGTGARSGMGARRVPGTAGDGAPA
jgi:hypothetical protein